VTEPVDSGFSKSEATVGWKARGGSLLERLKSLVGKSEKLSLERARRAFSEERYAAAAADFKLLAESGDPEAQWLLGQCYEQGAGVLRHPVYAVRHYRLAAEAGIVQAQARLGEILLTGLGAEGVATDSAVQTIESATTRPSVFQKLFPDGVSVAPKLDEAARWNTMAAESGEAGAQARLGHHFASGTGLERDLDRAAHWFKAAAEQGHVAGELGFGLLHVGFYGEYGSVSEAIPWLERAARQKDSTAKLVLALALLELPDAKRDPARAAKLLGEAARAGQVYAMYRLGEMYRTGTDTPVDLQNAETWLRRASAKGNVRALVSLVRLYAELPEPDLQAAVVSCREAAELGDPEAQYLMGVFVLEGHGAPKAPTEAFAWFQKSADQGVVGAYERLGAMYAEGLGVSQDYQAAAKWFHAAAEAGDHDALMHVGVMHMNGFGFEADPAVALKHYQDAAERGNANGCLQLGILYATGERVIQSYATAAHWYRKAWELGLPEGAYNLAELHLQGLGVSQNENAAIELLENAADQRLMPALWKLIELHGDNGIRPDAARTHLYLGQAAKLGDASAADALFRRYLDLPEDDAARTLESLEAAAAANNPAAMYCVARTYIGEGARNLDKTRAMEWLTRAADAGHTQAAEHLERLNREPLS